MKEYIKRRPVFNEDGEVIDYEDVRRPGRPKKVKSAIPSWLMDKGEENDMPDEIVLSEDAPLALLLVASFTNFLNRGYMDSNVERVLLQRGFNPTKIAADRDTYAMQVQQVRKEIYEKYRDNIMSMGEYILGDTTAGMGSVMAAMSGERDKRGNNRY